MKILLVDDEREEREGISWLIKKYKYPLEIVQAANGKEALQCIEKYKICLLYTSPSPRDRTRSRMPSSA